MAEFQSSLGIGNPTTIPRNGDQYQFLSKSNLNDGYLPELQTHPPPPLHFLRPWVVRDQCLGSLRSFNWKLKGWRLLIGAMQI